MKTSAARAPGQSSGSRAGGRLRPPWTLHAAAAQNYTGPGASWPLPYQAGSREPPTGRTDAPKPRLALGAR
ncbi:hypothetical protein ABZU86_34125 [Streptomyces sp. NPDC005271]|uniref:hypothetical protein n=1 Tax=unclassified Streptomyces TaxID=2593676 RepID=UPI0033AEE5EE